MNDILKCPNCDAVAGEKDEDHSKININYYTCQNCEYSWQDVIDITDWREDR